MRITTGAFLVVAFAGAVFGQTRNQQEAQLIRLAIELAAVRDPAPILLGADRASPVAAAYDRFSRAHAAARESVQRGAVLDPLAPPRTLSGLLLVVVAYPVTCDNRVVRATDVDIVSDTRSAPKWLPVSGAALQKLLSGVTLPTGAIGVQFQDTELRQGHTVRISYAETVCPGTTRRITVPVSKTDPRILERPLIEMPVDQPAPASSITLTLSGVIDLDGRLRYASAPEAATPFGKMALAAASQMKFDPARVNGSPVPWTAGVIVTFGVATAPKPIAGGSTPDAAGLTGATSQCQSSDDTTFGTFATRAIRIGGQADGVARIRHFLSVLRGPSGQGIRYEFSGPVMLGGKTIEGVEVRYVGLAEPVRLYFDTLIEDRLLAPHGFICAAPIVVR